MVAALVILMLTNLGWSVWVRGSMKDRQALEGQLLAKGRVLAAWRVRCLRAEDELRRLKARP